MFVEYVWWPNRLYVGVLNNELQYEKQEKNEAGSRSVQMTFI